MPDDPSAERRRKCELMRPIDVNSAIALRAVLLQFANGTAELILVTSRMILDGSTLRLLAQLLLTEGALPYLPIRVFEAHSATDTVTGRRETSSIPDWGLGGLPPKPGFDLAKGRELGKVTRPEFLFAAICVALTRFDGQTQVALGMIGDQSIERSRAFPNSRLLFIDIGSATTVGELASAVLACIGSDTSTEELIQAIDPAVGIVWNVDTHARENGGKYWPYLTPPFALTIELQVSNTGVFRTAYGFDLRSFSPSMVDSFDRAVATLYAELERQSTHGENGLIASVGTLDAAALGNVAAFGALKPLPSEFEPFRIERRIASFAMSHPHARALTYEERALTYCELEDLSSRIAVTLVEIGIREGERVGICLDRSLELVPVLLAVLKVGAAYVPLDPAYPNERITYILMDAQPTLTICEDKSQLKDVALRTISLEELLARAKHVCAPLSPRYESADAAAYVIYTSGSTGRPKGVIVPHRNFASLVAATADEFNLSSVDTWTMFHSSAFDFSVWEIWGCLATGGHLVVVPYWITRSPDEFLQLLARERVTVLNQTPSAFAQLQVAENDANLKLALRLVIFGGEPLNARMLLGWFDRYPESVCRLVNMFGITETTVHVTAETITRVHALASSRVVGRPIPGWYAYVMDPYQHLLPLGVPGEIYVGGAGVADQYLNREDLNEHRFLKDPYVDGRIYRSGDRGRLRADGRLEHLGRLDSQVKLRGFRIELDEISSVLLESPSVLAAAVVVNQVVSGDAATTRLDAYVVLGSGTVADVNRHAARLLPEYMVPTTITVLESIPLTTNGKIDVAGLPTPKIGMRTLSPNKIGCEPAFEDSPLMSPTNQSGAKLATLLEIWCDVLGVDVSLDDNFFDLGGNSLFAVRIATMMRDRGLPNLPLRELYLRQTVRGIANYLDTIQ